jgi:hypothetical protein
MPVGEYSKQYLKEEYARLRPNDVELILRKPKIDYGLSTLSLPSSQIKKVLDQPRLDLSPSSQTQSVSQVLKDEDTIGTLQLINSGISAAAAVPGLPQTGLDLMKKVGMASDYSMADQQLMRLMGQTGGTLTDARGALDASKIIPMKDLSGASSAGEAAAETFGKSSNFVRLGANTEKEIVLPSTLTKAASVGEAIGSSANAAGAVLSGVGLGLDIQSAIEDKHVTFNNAMKMADDGTGLVASLVGLAPGIGTAISLGLIGGEKVVTTIIKGIKAVNDEKKKEGLGKGDHLKPGVWLDTVVDATIPKWMTEDIGTQIKEWKAN